MVLVQRETASVDGIFEPETLSNPFLTYKFTFKNHVANAIGSEVCLLRSSVRQISQMTFADKGPNGWMSFVFNLHTQSLRNFGPRYCHNMLCYTIRAQSCCPFPAKCLLRSTFSMCWYSQIFKHITSFVTIFFWESEQLTSIALTAAFWRTRVP
jgi:hypothetical protein